jgi:hypothetical protein
MSRAATAVRRPSQPASRAITAKHLAGGYFEESAGPLSSLVFLAPLIVIYELGTRWYASDPVSHVEQRIIAFSLMQQFFSFFGATGKYMPPAAVVSILLGWHIVRNDSWVTHIGYLMVMVVESALYALPLRALALVFSHYLPLYPSPDHARALLVLSVGAGIYEEMLFRMVAFCALHFVLFDLMKMRKVPAFLLMVLITSVMFSAYHYLGSETFEWRSFVFRTLAGMYFAGIFIWRGFGITAGAHAAYDISTFTIHLLTTC